MNIKNLIELLPPLFKSSDTYKVNGKGFLERYLEICGNYLTDIITPDIDNILDIISIDTTPKEYLNYLWEFLGEIPFANIYNIDSDKWALYYDGTHNKEELWLNPNHKPISLKDQTARDLIKYSLSLYKIRGTKKFFDIILSLYGLEYKGSLTSTPPYYRTGVPYLDVDVLDHTNLDEYHYCSQCGIVDINIDDSKHELVFADKNGVIIMGSNHKVLTGKSPYINPSFDDENGGELEFFDLKQLVTAYNNYQGNIDFSNTRNLPADVKMFVILRRTFESFFDRFTPYNTKVDIYYDGIKADDNIQFNVLYDDPDNSILSEDNKSVGLLVNSSSKWPVYDRRYQVSGNDTDWSGEYHTTQKHIVTSPGTYYFKLASTDIIIPVTVGISKIVEPYSLQIDKSSVIYLSDYTDNKVSITPSATLGNTKLGTTVVLPDGSTNEISPGSNFTIDTQGIYKVYITNYPLLYKHIYVYLQSLDSKTSLVDIPYGVEVTVQHGVDENEIPILETYGIHFDENIDPMPIAIVESTLDGTYENRKIISIVPWIIDPNNPSKVLKGEEFIKTNFAVSLAIMDSSKLESEGKAYYTQAIESGGVSSDVAIDYINNLISTSSKSVSVLITISQLNIKDYYDPYMVTEQTWLSNSGNMYLHNPVIVNIVVPSNGDQPMVGGSKFIQTNEVPGTSYLSITAKGYSDTDTSRNVSLIGAILMDNTKYMYLPLYGDDQSQDYPYYCYNLKLSPNQTMGLDISGLKLKNQYGVTIRRNVVAFELDNLGVINVPDIIISDTQDETGSIDGLTMIMYTESDTMIYPSGLGGLDIKLEDGTNIKISREYIVKLNNPKGLSEAKFKFQLIVGGIIFNDDGLSGGIILDLDGNTYNTKLTYTEHKVRYYRSELGSVPGNHGYIFTVRSFGDDPDYNIMLSIVIDPAALDRYDMVFDMVPENFYLPVNGKSAITNMLVSRPYAFYNGLGGYVMYTEGNTTVAKDTPLEYRTSTGSSSQKLFTANGTDVTGKEKIFNVIKNN